LKSYLCKKTNLAIILNIETATKNCSVSIARNGKVLGLKELNNGQYSHSEVLHAFIEELLNDLKIEISQIDAVAVSKGPGSYTGLRIGVSAAKGFCFALNKPLISVDTLASLANALDKKDGIIIPMIDARRMEAYTAIFNFDYEQIRETKAEIIHENSYLEYLSSSKVFFIGDCTEKCKHVITHKNAFFIEKFPSAKEMAIVSYNKYKKNDIENIAYFEPFYLKDFVVIPEKKKKSIF